MSRISAGESRIEIKPTNNIYTVLVASAVVVEIVALVVLIMRNATLFDKSLWSSRCPRTRGAGPTTQTSPAGVRRSSTDARPRDSCFDVLGNGRILAKSTL